MKPHAHRFPKFTDELQLSRGQISEVTFVSVIAQVVWKFSPGTKTCSYQSRCACFLSRPQMDYNPETPCSVLV